MTAEAEARSTGLRPTTATGAASQRPTHGALTTRTSCPALPARRASSSPAPAISQASESHTRTVSGGGWRSVSFTTIEMVIEGRDFVHLRHRELHLRGQRRDVGGRDASVLVLDPVQILDQQIRAAGVVAQQRPHLEQGLRIDAAAPSAWSAPCGRRERRRQSVSRWPARLFRSSGLEVRQFLARVDVAEGLRLVVEIHLGRRHRPVHASTLRPPPSRKAVSRGSTLRRHRQNTGCACPSARTVARSAWRSSRASFRRATRSAGRKGESHGTVAMNGCAVAHIAACSPASGPANPAMRSPITGQPNAE